MITTAPQMMTIKEAAKYIGQSEATVRRLIADGFLARSQIRPRGRVQISREDIDRLMRAR